ncbi:cysteine--tRNA ligase [Halobacteriovorax sp. XZX-3]|uniref:cysteine--tRNA ligase n=1 Tax=unclassified Halobacteriovorax TaxID=2639665 RepID=UPI00371B1A9C
MSLVVYNTLTKKKETFTPLEEGKVKLYLCGPTVYGPLHIGNFRGPIFFNFARNWMEHIGYDVNFVYNYTDVDDKIINKANEEGVDSLEISERYIKYFQEDFGRLGLRPHTHNPKVTDYIPEIIEYVQGIIDNGMAYVVDGEVFYETTKLESYGELSGVNLEELNSGERVEVDERKKDPKDFVLWKPAKPGEPSWDSPWGKGRPGWHIECSAMIKSILGKSIDIHGGGIDLIFPHHENEIAQGVGCNSCKYVNYWMHNNFINMSGEKMSKSLGNIITARAFMDEYHPEILKYIMLSTHYRSMLDVTDEKIDQAFGGAIRVYRALQVAKHAATFETNESAKVNKKLAEDLKRLDAKIEKACNDDFNTSEMMSAVYEAVKTFNTLNLEKKAKDVNSAPTAIAFSQWIAKYGKMSALFAMDPEIFLNEIKEVQIRRKGIALDKVNELLAKRADARAAKDWDAADAARDELNALGIDFQESGDEVTWSVRV